MRNEKLYLCGPMSGIEGFNHPLFNATAAALRGAGYLVFNPAENGLPEAAKWADHMRVDIARLMLYCDALATLPGVEASKGARLEIHIAKELGMRVSPACTWLDTAAP